MKVELIKTNFLSHSSDNFIKELSKKIEELETNSEIIDIKYACVLKGVTPLYSALIIYK
jgi:hypothetical protein